MKPFSTLSNKKTLNNILTTRQMSQVRGGSTLTTTLVYNSENDQGEDTNLTEALDDDKRRTRPGGGGVTS
jgi:hypothetical protein